MREEREEGDENNFRHGIGRKGREDKKLRGMREKTEGGGGGGGAKEKV